MSLKDDLSQAKRDAEGAIEHMETLVHAVESGPGHTVLEGKEDIDNLALTVRQLAGSVRAICSVLGNTEFLLGMNG